MPACRTGSNSRPTWTTSLLRVVHGLSKMACLWSTVKMRAQTAEACAAESGGRPEARHSAARRFGVALQSSRPSAGATPAGRLLPEAGSRSAPCARGSRSRYPPRVIERFPWVASTPASRGSSVRYGATKAIPHRSREAPCSAANRLPPPAHRLVTRSSRPGSGKKQPPGEFPGAVPFLERFAGIWSSARPPATTEEAEKDNPVSRQGFRWA